MHFTQSLTDGLISAMMTALLCVLAPITIPVGVVPVSMSTLLIFVLIYGMGWKRTLLSVGLYLLLGMMGLPVFSGHTGGVQKLFGATGGYLLGYLPMTAIAGWGITHSRKRWVQVLAMLLGEAALYLLGTAWFCMQAGTDVLAALAVCVYPFLPLDVAKIVAAALLGENLKKRLEKAIKKGRDGA